MIQINGEVVVCPIDFEGLLDPRLLKEVGDLNTTNLSNPSFTTSQSLVSNSGNQPPAAKVTIIITESKIPGVSSVASINRSWVVIIITLVVCLTLQ
ncbi:MAG: hypothetical protein V7K76_11995 [Nostoc sp.]|uniref:hypothetical protein n=1 Tax=Nostoc sp. TaxID=1180 RepID=UPI002FFC06AE